MKKNRFNKRLAYILIGGLIVLAEMLNKLLAECEDMEETYEKHKEQISRTRMRYRRFKKGHKNDFVEFINVLAWPIYDLDDIIGCLLSKYS